MKQYVLLTACLALLLGVTACSGKFSEHLDPQLAIQVSGDSNLMEFAEVDKKDSPEDECPSGASTACSLGCCPTGLIAGPDCEYCFEYYEFNPLGEGQTRREAVVSVYNNGDDDLTIDEIYFQEDRDLEVEGKADEIEESIFLEQEGAYDPTDSDTFPLLIETGLGAPKLQFRVVYEPEPGDMGIVSKTLVIKSNDPEFRSLGEKYKMIFRVKNVGPEMKVNRKSITYSCVSGVSHETIIVDNIGTDVLAINKIDFASPTSEFSITNPPSLPLYIPKKGNPDYNSLSFTVRYDPGDDNYDDENQIVITTNDPHLSAFKLIIPIDVQQAPAKLEFSNDSPFAYLDFSNESSHVVNIYNKHSDECSDMCAEGKQCCGCPIQLKGVDIEPEDAVDWYTTVARDPTSGDELPLPRSLKGGAAIEFVVSYEKPAGHPEDKNGTMCIRYVSPLAGPQEHCVNLMAHSQCEFSVAPLNQLLHFNSVSPADVKEKPAVLVNSGSAACTVSHVSVTDKWSGASEDFSLKEVIPGDSKIEPFSIMPVWIQFSPHSQQDLTGKLVIEYVDDVVGIVETVINLNGTKEQECVLPVAEPGTYMDVKAGQTVNLNGCGSSSGDCGSPIFDNGYIWYLVSKPEASGYSLNAEGGCVTPFSPDVAGTYEIGLLVYDSKDFYQSDLAITTIDVAPAEE